MITIRPMKKSDTSEIIEMMQVFYNSDAVITNGSREIFENDIKNCIDDCPFLEGYVFCKNNTILGYAMVSKSFSTEFAKPCIWIEDLYVKPKFQRKGIAKSFFEFIEQKYPNHLFKLEVEETNKNAICAYQKCGFENLDYLIMKKF